jgi:TP901-1 family phage major tail protein
MSVAGRKTQLFILAGTEYALVAALKSKTLTFNNDPIDVTTDDDDGFRKYIDDRSGMRSCDIKCEGVYKDRAQLMELADSEAAVTLRFIIPGTTTLGLQVDGTFKVTGMELGAAMEEGVTFSATFASSGTYTVGAVPTA